MVVGRLPFLLGRYLFRGYVKLQGGTFWANKSIDAAKKAVENHRLYNDSDSEIVSCNEIFKNSRCNTHTHTHTRNCLLSCCTSWNQHSTWKLIVGRVLLFWGPASWEVYAVCRCYVWFTECIFNASLCWILGVPMDEPCRSSFGHHLAFMWKTSRWKLKHPFFRSWDAGQNGWHSTRSTRETRSHTDGIGVPKGGDFWREKLNFPKELSHQVLMSDT